MERREKLLVSIPDFYTGDTKVFKPTILYLICFFGNVSAKECKCISSSPFCLPFKISVWPGFDTEM